MFSIELLRGVDHEVSLSGMKFMGHVKTLLTTTPQGRFILLPYRLKLAVWHYRHIAINVIRWLKQSREITNFTYDLTPRNITHLASFVAVVTGIDFMVAIEYLNELRQDDRLRRHVQQLMQQYPERWVADEMVKYGRRLGWYAFVRAKKPRIVVETGVDKGLGSCVIAAALLKNYAEGSPGYYYGTDINPRAGYLLQEPYNQYGQILYGDSIESLQKLNLSIDLFINDSDHSAEYEGREYDLINAKLTEDALILGDNAHCTDELHNFARRTKRNFLFFKEEPDDHWYLGAGIGVVFGKSEKS